jgi:hypothetical protein
MKYRYDPFGKIPYRNMYKTPVPRREYQVFNEDYFSGSDVNIFFGKIWVDEIVNLSYSLTEQVLPIYGYNSFTYDAIARGRRIIEGQFTINFKSVGYLKELLKNADAVEQQINETAAQMKISPKDIKKYKLDEILKMAGKRSFNDHATAMQNAIWGEENSEEELLSNAYETFFPKSDFGFDIHINYGPVTEYAQNKNEIKKLNEKYGKNHNPDITVESINGIQITSYSKTGIETSADGRPITETYGFIARDINSAFLF